MKFFVCGQTDKGLSRANNEDNFCVEEKLGLFAVADGIGGQASGEIASKMAMEALRDYIKRSSDADEQYIGEYKEKYSEASNRLASGIRLANKAIYEASKDNAAWRGMGTTVAAALMRGDRLSIAHAGDSRVYLIRADSIVQLTDDHSVVSEQVRQGLLTKEEAEGSGLRNIITRALGNNPSVEVDLDEVVVMDGDKVLLCTDGLTTMAADDAILSAVINVKKPDAACSELIGIANKNGGKDNITVVAVYIYKGEWLYNIKTLFGLAGR